VPVAYPRPHREEQRAASQWKILTLTSLLMKICSNNNHAKKQIKCKIFFLWYTIIEVNTAFSEGKKKNHTVQQIECFVVNALKDAKVKTIESSTEHNQ